MNSCKMFCKKSERENVNARKCKVIYLLALSCTNVHVDFTWDPFAPQPQWHPPDPQVRTETEVD